MTEVVRVGGLTPQDLKSLGMQRIAYVRPVEGDSAFAVHAADGTQIAVMKSRELAIVAIRQHDLEALSVH